MRKLYLVLLIAIAIIVFSKVVKAQDMVGYWKFDEGSGTVAYDSSPFKNDGTINNCTWIIGKFGSALNFDGVNDYIDAGNASVLNPTSQITLEAWVYPTSTGSYKTVISKYADDTDYVYKIDESSSGNTFRGYLFNTTGSYCIASDSSTFSLNSWYHLIFIYNGTNGMFYRNGTLVGSCSMSGPIKTSTKSLKIGSSATGGEYFNGIIDEVKVWNRALNETEIKSEYEVTDCDSQCKAKGFSSGRCESGTVATINKAVPVYGIGWSDGDITFAAQHFTLVDTDFGHSAAIQSLKTKNANVKVVGYKDAMFSDSTRDDWATVNANEAWFVHDANGSRIYNHVWSCWLMDVSNVGWRQHVVSYLNNKFSSEPAYDGVLLDDIWDAMPDWAVAVFSPQVVPTSVRNALHTNMIGFLQYLKANITLGKIIIANTDDWNDNDYLNIVNGMTIEGYEHASWESATSYDRPSIDVLAGRCATGKIVWAASGIDGSTATQTQIDAMLKYCYVSFLVGMCGSNTYWSWTSTGGAIYNDLYGGFQPIMDTDIGQPIGAYYQSQNVSMRDYTKGKAIINPSSNTYTVNLGGNYKLLDGTIVSSVILNSYSGEILLNSNSGSCQSSESSIGQDSCSSGLCCCKSDLVGYWKFDEGSGTTANDSSVYANNGTLVNNPTWVIGKIGNALSFDGLNDYVQVPSNSLFQGGNMMTLEVWVKPSSLSASQMVLEKGDTNLGGAESGPFYLAICSDGRVVVDVYDTTATANGFASSSVLSPNNWYHLALVINTTEPVATNQVKLYNNGNQETRNSNGCQLNTENNIGTIRSNTQPLFIGIRDTQGTKSLPFSGTIDEVKIWNRALSADEIKNEYGVQTTTPINKAVYAFGAYFSTSEATFVANHFNLLDIGGAWEEPLTTLASIKAQNPTMKIIGYKNFLQEVDPSNWLLDDWAEVNSHEDWFIHDINGNRVTTAASVPGVTAGNYIMDPASGWRQHLSSYLNNKINNAEYDGIMADDVHNVFPTFYLNSSEVALVKSADISRWHADTLGLVQYVKANLLPGKLFIINTDEYQTHTYLDYADGKSCEGPFHGEWLAPTDHSQEIYTINYINLLIRDASLGKIVWIVEGATYTNTADINNVAKFIYAAYLCTLTGNMYLSFNHWKTDTLNGYLPIMDTNIGQPTGAYYSSQNVSMRDFTDGKVLLNPSTSTYTINLGENYKTLDGQTVSSITMNAYTGEILLKITQVTTTTSTTTTSTTTSLTTSTTTIPSDTQSPQWSDLRRNPPAFITTLDSVTINVTWSDNQNLNKVLIWENSTGNWQPHIV
jgi:hypothetical protein